VMVGLSFPVAMGDAVDDNGLADFRPEFQGQVEPTAGVPEVFTPVKGNGTIYPQSVVAVD
jgi:hypothetical protein